MENQGLPLIILKDSDIFFNDKLVELIPTLLLIDKEKIKKEITDRNINLYESSLIYIPEMNLEMELLKINEAEYKVKETNTLEIYNKLGIRVVLVTKMKNKLIIKNDEEVFDNKEIKKITNIEKEDKDKLNQSIENVLKLKASMHDKLEIAGISYDITYIALNNSDVMIFIQDEHSEILHNIEKNFKIDMKGNIKKDKNYRNFADEYKIEISNIKEFFDDTLIFKEMEEKIKRGQMFGAKKQIVLNEALHQLLIMIKPIEEMEECSVSVLKIEEVELLMKEHKEEDLMSDVENNFESNILKMLAHQWRQPLTNVKLELDMLKMTLEDEEMEEEIENIVSISKEIKKLSETIHNFTEVLGDNSNKKIVTTYRSIITKTVKIMEENLLNDFITIETSYGDFTNLHISQADVSRVLVMLITNSIENLVTNKIEDKTISIKTKETADFVELLVIDNGGGFDFETYSESDFLKPYVSTRGLNDKGIGLYMVNKIMKKIHGKIFLYNEEKEELNFFTNEKEKQKFAIVKLLLKKG